MKQKNRSFLRMGVLVLVLVLALTALVTLVGASVMAVPDQAVLNAPQAAIDNPAACTVTVGSVTCDLYAITGTLTLADGIEVPIWGYSDTSGMLAQLPGPTIIATEGDAITITLHNNLTEDTALMFPGQAMIPDLTGAAANGGTQTYAFTASDPGTYLYEAGLLPDAPRQVAMGMFGALVVRPASDPNHAYDVSSAFDDEALLVLSEIDPNLNNNPAGFDMRDFVPQYRLINGLAYPQTAEISTAAGNRVLLRYINAGIQQHTMGLLGMDQELIARDGSQRPYPQRELTESIGPGRTADAIVTVPALAAPGLKYALYDASLLLHNNGVGFGGMLTFLTVAGTVTPPGTGPTTGPVALAPNPTDGSVDVTLSTSISGPSSITNAEYFVDATGADGSGCALTVGANTGSVSVSATIPAAAGATPPCADLTTLAHGDHTFYVHGSDGTWGAFNFAVLHLDKLGPATTGITLAPNPSDGSLGIAVSATGNDSATGNSDIAAAEFFIGTPGGDGSGTPMSVNVAAPIASLDGAIISPTMGLLPEGAHIVSVHSMDAFLHWGDYATAILKVDQTGPTTSNVVANPNPNNGELPYSPTVFAVRVDATLSDPMTPDVNSNILRVEGFIDTIGADGAGFPLSPRDGLFNESVEDAYVYIPLSTISTLGVGTHQIWIHGQDASGNWGAAVAVDLIIDKTAPTVSNVMADPNPSGIAISVTLTADAADTASPIVLAEWFDGGDPGRGNGMPMAALDGALDSLTEVLTDTINVSAWAPGDHTLSIRAQDAAGNWSATETTLLCVVKCNDVFADSFGSGDTAAWSSTTGAVSVIPGAAMDGDGNGMAADISGGTASYVTDGTPDGAETSYHARFYFNPNSALSNNNAAITLLDGQDAGNTSIFRVEYRRRNAQGGTYQVRGVVLTAGGEETTGWVNINDNSANAIEIAWESGLNATFDLYVHGGLQETLAGLDTSAYTLDAVHLGPSGGNGLNGSALGSVYLDAFVSTRYTVIGQ
jgi:FtsP/CotA-like multicopper oxidase with cupredoxin domain